MCGYVVDRCLKNCRLAEGLLQITHFIADLAKVNRADNLLTFFAVHQIVSNLHFIKYESDVFLCFGEAVELCLSQQLVVKVVVKTGFCFEKLL